MTYTQSFIMLCGLPGAGKSTYAKILLEENSNNFYQVVSSDSIRQELYGDESEQGDPNEVFSKVRTDIEMYLRQGYSVVYDATNLTRKDRRKILEKIPCNVLKECHVVWDWLENCIETDEARDRTVGADIIFNMAKRFQAPYYDEGFAVVKYNVSDRDVWFNPRIEENNILHDNRHHTLTIQEHMVKASRYLDKSEPEFIKIAAAIHDIGKPYVKEFKDSKGNDYTEAHYYRHENVGGWQAYGAIELLPYASLTEEEKVFIIWLVCNHMEPFHNSRYYQKLPLLQSYWLDKLHEADRAAH